MKAFVNSDNRLRTQVREILGRSNRPRPPIPIPQIVRRYQILREIGRGARAHVYLARTRHAHRRVAIKVLRYADLESRQRFWREAMCASSLKHGNIIAVYEIVRTAVSDAIVMEYAQGKTLDRVIPKGGLSLKNCVAYALQIAQALAAIHSAKLIHRDLKPRNLIITNKGVVKVLDFGLAKRIDPRAKSSSHGDLETRQGTILGTMAYMAPEQALGEPADQRSDVFSFGALLFEMLTGQRAFQGTNNVTTLRAVAFEPPPALPRSIPARIARILRRCLTKDPNQRYQTAMELAADLERVISSTRR